MKTSVLLLATLLAIQGNVSGAVDAADVHPKSSFSTDESDLWWNPNESGWGMQLVQQGSFIFATVFIYGTDGKPTWVTAQLDPVGNLTWTGPLFVTSGPWFGGPFDPAAVGLRQAGTMTLNIPNVQSGTVTYSIDGVTVTKAVRRQLLALDNYNGSYLAAINLTATGCTSSASNGFITGLMGVDISQTATAMSMQWSFANGSVCTYSGGYSQDGRMGTFDGSYTCSAGEVGTMHVFEMTNRVGMISARVRGGSTNIGCQYAGRLTGLDPSKP